MEVRVAGILTAALLLVLAFHLTQQLRRELREGLSHSLNEEGEITDTIRRSESPWLFRASILGQILLILLIVLSALLCVWLPTMSTPIPNSDSAPVEVD